MMLYSKEMKVRAMVSTYLLDNYSSENLKENNCGMDVPSEYHMMAAYLYNFLRSKDAFKLKTKVILYILCNAMGFGGFQVWGRQLSKFDPVEESNNKMVFHEQLHGESAQ